MKPVPEKERVFFISKSIPVMNNRILPSKLEPLEWRHAHDLQRVVNDPALSEWSNMPDSYFAHGAQSLIQRSIHQSSKAGNHMLALYLGEDLSGVFSIQRDAETVETGHLLFWIESRCWKSGKSIAYLQDVVAFAMEELNLKQLYTIFPLIGRSTKLRAGTISSCTTTKVLSRPMRICIALPGTVCRASLAT